MTNNQAVEKNERILLGCLLGHQFPLVPVPIPAEQFACHTAILAQSGSGKSFFVGRLIEELLLRSRCRVVILDPNSDFVRVDEVNEAVWKDLSTKKWFLAEDTPEAFKTEWSAIKKCTLTNRSLGAGAIPIRVLFSSLGEQGAGKLLQIGTDDPGQYWLLVAGWAIADRESPDDFNFYEFESVIRRLAEIKLKSGSPESAWSEMEPFKRFDSLTSEKDIGSFMAKLDALRDWEIWGYPTGDQSSRRSANSDREEFHDFKSYLDDSFFGDAEKYRLLTIDLQSLETLQEKQLVTSMLLESAWEWARRSQARRLEDLAGPWEQQRLPIFVVIDEAHNLAPSSSLKPDVVHDQLVRIAAEGRKYDLFLILVSQSPSKIDANVLTQSQNVCILKLNSEIDIQSIASILGFPSPEIVKLSTSFDKGDAILAGGLAEYPLLFHAFPRRTEQGGRSLSRTWTRRETNVTPV